TMASCGGEARPSANSSDAPPAPIVRDSAGVRIIELREAVLDQLPMWRLTESPVAVIGEVAGESPYVFTGIGASRVSSLRNGGIAITDEWKGDGSLEVRIFDESGRYLMSFGRAGRGPCKFVRPRLIHEAADGGMVVYDRGLSRVTRFNSDGSVADTWSWNEAACSNENQGRP